MFDWYDFIEEWGLGEVLDHCASYAVGKAGGNAQGPLACYCGRSIRSNQIGEKANGG